MLGPIIGITTSIATMGAVACAQAGASIITGGGRRRQAVPVHRLVVRKNANNAIEMLGAELMRERRLRLQTEAECDRLREMVEAAEEAIAIMQRGA